MENNPGDSSSQKSDKSIMQTVDLLSLSNQTPILRGHVFKQSSDRFRHKYDLLSFKKRYFVLYKGVLLYYVHESNFEKDLHRKLKAGKVILLEDLFLTEHSIARAHSFALHVPHADNKRERYLLAFSNRKAKNIWIEMLQQQNGKLEPPTSETNGHTKPLPAYIHKIRTLDQPSCSIRSQSLPQTSVHIGNLHNYHYSRRPHRRETWAGERLNVFEKVPESVIRKSARRDSSLSSIDSSTVGSTDESSEQSMTDSDTSLAL